ncbi:MAG: hypothetical protein ACRDZM_01765 [Acidimicrobiia bacterium]
MIVGSLLMVLVGGASLAFISINGAAGTAFDEFVLAAAAMLFLTVGVVILIRADGNRVGWVMASIAMVLLLGAVADDLADRGGPVAGAIGGALWLSWFVILGFLVLWFPTGRTITARWRFMNWWGFVLFLVTLSYLVAEQLCVTADDSGRCQTWVDNPIGIPGVPNPEYGEASTVGYLLLAGFVVVAAATQVIRYIRARTVERLQVKWFAFAVVALIGTSLAQETLADLTPIPTVVWDIAWGIAVLALPIAIGVSVLKHRLFEIDRIVSRTVTYLLVVGLLGAVFFGVVTLITSFLPAESDLAVAASTLAVAALFNPVRHRVQVWIDRRFNRARYDAQRVMDSFARSLRDRVNPTDVSDGWRDVVSETMQPSAVSVWIRS